MIRVLADQISSVESGEPVSSFQDTGTSVPIYARDDLPEIRRPTLVPGHRQ